MSDPYVDGAVPFGSRVETIRDTPIIFENVSIKKPSKVIERHDQIGRPNGWVSVPGFITGTATVQVPTEAFVGPNIGDSFTDTFGDTTGLWVITEADEAYHMNEYWKRNITFRYSPNPP